MCFVIAVSSAAFIKCPIKDMELCGRWCIFNAPDVREVYYRILNSPFFHSFQGFLVYCIVLYS